MQKLRYPVGIQSFAKLREEEYLYFDKTAFLARLTDSPGNYLLCRPHRFGKSLLTSTLEAYFGGRHDLFLGLAIDTPGRDWTPRPVLHLDLSGWDYTEVTPDEALRTILAEECERLGLRAKVRTPGEMLRRMVRDVAERDGRKVAVLIDEYDKPLADCLHLPERLKNFSRALRAFYSNLKLLDPCIGFTFLTGLTRFASLSLFSGLNHLNDISLSVGYATICGATRAELKQALGLEEEALERLRGMYGGYRFAAGAEEVYNPFSLLRAIESGRDANYWLADGTPAFFPELLRDAEVDVSDICNTMCAEESLACFGENAPTAAGLFYQSGYLTIRDHDPEEGLYRLGFPNREVERSFFRVIMPLLANLGGRDTAWSVARLKRYLREGDVDSFMEAMRSFFADCPYETLEMKRLERHYHNVVYIVAKLLGVPVETEYRTSRGRIDLTIRSGEYIYIIEFKIDKSARQALRQIRTNRYADPFRCEGQRIILVGVNFSSRQRGIESWVIEKVNKC